MPFVYILECADGTFYVGSTRLLAERVEQHQLGLGAVYTRKRLPVRLVWSEEHEHVGAAFGREKQIQNWGRAKREALIAGRYDALPDLARGPRSHRLRPQTPDPGLDSLGAGAPPGSTTEK